MCLPDDSISLEVTNGGIKSPVLPGLGDPEEAEEMVLFSFAQVLPLRQRHTLTAFASFHSGIFGKTAKRKRRDANILQEYFVILLEIKSWEGARAASTLRCQHQVTDKTFCHSTRGKWMPLVFGRWADNSAASHHRATPSRVTLFALPRIRFG